MSGEPEPEGCISCGGDGKRYGLGPWIHLSDVLKAQATYPIPTGQRFGSGKNDRRHLSVGYDFAQGSIRRRLHPAVFDTFYKPPEAAP